MNNRKRSSCDEVGKNFSLQGQKLSSAETDPFGLGTNTSYSGYGLVYESSQDSFSSNSSFLPPVPSLPGLAAPDDAASSHNQQLKFVKVSAAAGKSVSPVQHRAWQEVTASAKQAGAIPSYKLPDPQQYRATSKKEKAGGPNKQQLPQTTKCRASQPGVGPSYARIGTTRLSPQQQHVARHGPSSHKLPSKHGLLEQSQQLQQQQARQYASGSNNNTSSHRQSTSRQMDSSWQQASCENVFERTQHLTTIVLPPGVKTGLDAVTYFGSGAGKPSDLIYCNLASCERHPDSCHNTADRQTASGSGTCSSAGTAKRSACDCATCQYNPYDLVAVRQEDADKQQHFIVSYNGVIQMRPGEPPDMTPHAEWLRQGELFNVLSKLPFFKQQLMRTAFEQWNTNVVRQRFHSRQRQLEAQLLAHPAARQTLQQAHKLLSAYLSDGIAGQHRLQLITCHADVKYQGAEPVETTTEQPSVQPAVSGSLTDRAVVCSTASAASAETSGVSVIASTACLKVSTSSHVETGPSASSESSNNTLQANGAMPPTATAIAQTATDTNPANCTIMNPPGPIFADQHGLNASNNSLEAVWKRCNATGGWQLTVQKSTKRRDDNLDTLFTTTGTAAAHQQLSSKGSSSNKHMSTPAQLVGSSSAASAKATFPLQSMAGPKATVEVPMSKPLLGRNANAPAAALMQGKVLEALCGVFDMAGQGPMTLSDFMSWRARTQLAVSNLLSKLHSQLMDCLARLEQHLEADAAAGQAAAAAAEQAVKEAGRKPPLPWNEPERYNVQYERRKGMALLSRVAYFVDVMATSCVAQLAATATAQLLSSMLLPWDAASALRLCPQQYQPLLLNILQQQSDQQQQALTSAIWPGSLQIKVQASIQDVEFVLQEQQQQQGIGAMVSCLRLSPTYEELESSVGNLPGLFINMLNTLPLLCNEPAVRQWKQQAAKIASAAAPATHNKPGFENKTSLRVNAATAHQQCRQEFSPARHDVTAQQVHQGAEGRGCKQRPTSHGSRSIKSRNARLEVFLATSGALEVQAAVSSLLQQHFSSTVDSPQLQPLRDASPLVLLCSNFDAAAYLQTQLSACHISADITATATWLSHLTEHSNHSVSFAPVLIESWADVRNTSCCGDTVKCSSSPDGCIGSSGSYNCNCQRTPTEGLVVVEIGSMRTALLKMAGSTLGSLLELLQPAFMRQKQALLVQVNNAITLLQQRPDSLDPFTAWLDAITPHLLPGQAAAVAKAGRAAHPDGQAGASESAKVDRTFIMTEFEALRMLLDVMRPGSGSYIANLVNGSNNVSVRPGSPGYEATEPAAAALRQLGPAPVRAATSALSELQSRLMAYKDASRVAGGYATAGAKSLAPDMASHLAKARQQLVELLVQLRTGNPSKASCAADQALQQTRKLMERHADLLQKEAQHLEAAGLFRERSVAAAVQGFKELSVFLTEKALGVSTFRTAQQDYAAQLDALYSTPATSDACQELLQQLQRCMRIMLDDVQRVEAMHPGDDVCNSATATAEEVSLAAAVRLDLTAWQARLPLGTVLIDPAITQRHRLMLLQVMDLAENTASWHGSNAVPPASIAGLSRSAGAEECSNTGQLSHSVFTGANSTLATCMQYGLVKADLYQEVFLYNSTTQPFEAETDDDTPRKHPPLVDDLLQLRCSTGTNVDVGGLGQNCCVQPPLASVAELLVWLSRSNQTAAVLQRVLDIAKQEQYLAQQVAAIDAKLCALQLELSGSRVAGCFMITNLPQLAEQLQEVQGQLQAVAQHWCHHGVEQQLCHVQAMQQDILGTVQACRTSQEQLLYLHNLFNHPALQSSFSSQHRALYTAAVKAWAPAVLKIRSSLSHHGGSKGPAVGPVSCSKEALQVGSSGSSHDPAAAGIRMSDAASDVAQAGKLSGCSLLKHLDILAAAAQEAQLLIKRARTAAAAVLVPELRRRWPRLALAPEESLLQFLEQLPAMYRLAIAEQPLQLPLPLLDVMFRGVMHMLPRTSARGTSPMMRHDSGVGQQAGLHSMSSSTQSFKAGRLPPMTSGHAELPSTAASIDIRSSSAVLLQAGSHQQAVPMPHTISGSLHEPLSAAEAAAANGATAIHALACMDWNTSSTGLSASAMQGRAVDLLPLHVLHNPQQSSRHDMATISRQQQLVHHQQRCGSVGVKWVFQSCPASLLQSLHTAASAALRHQTYQAIQSAGKLQLEDWAGGCCKQALLLADSVVWTGAASRALHELESGNSHALRALEDSAVLQLETVTNILRRNKLCSDRKGLGWPADDASPEAPQVLVVDEDEQQKDLVQGQSKLQPAQDHKDASNSRPPTPTPTDALPVSKAGHCSSFNKGVLISKNVEEHNKSAQTASGNASVSGISSCGRDPCKNCSSNTASKGCLTAQQLYGLQLLVVTGTCHREATAALVAAGVDGPAAFEWGQQLRHYWLPNEGQLQVCFGPHQLQYGWEFCPAATASLAQPLAAGLMSGLSLIAAAGLALPPAVGLDVSSWASNCRQRHSHGSRVSGNEKLQGCGAPVVVPAVPGIVDALGALTGLCVNHFFCKTSTTGRDIQQWLSSVVAAASDMPAAAETAGIEAGTCHSGDVTESAAGGDAAVKGIIFGSIIGLQHLQPTALAAFSRALRDIHDTIKHQQQAKASGGQSCCSLQKLRLPDGSYMNATGNTTAAAVARMTLICEVPAAASSSSTALNYSAAACPYMASSSRADVVDAVQRCGRCVAVQAPRLQLLVECGFRQLGFVDCTGAAAILAALLQQAADMQSCASDPPADPSATKRAVTVMQDTSLSSTCNGQQQVGNVGCAFVQQLLRRLSGLQQQGLPALQPGSTAWGALGHVLQDCVLPMLDQQQHTVLLSALETGLRAAQRAGRVTGQLAAAAQPSSPNQEQVGSSPTSTEAAGVSADFIETATKAGSSINVIQLWTAEQVDTAVRRVCSHSTRRASRNSRASDVANRNAVSDTVPAAGGAADALPAMHVESTVEVTTAVHAALHLHGGCILTGSTGVGKTLAWKTLAAAYDTLGVAGASPVWVHCCAEVLHAVAATAADTATNRAANSALEQFTNVLQSYHAATVRLECSRRRGSATKVQQSTTTTTIPETGVNTISSASSAVPQPNILVLDVDILQGPVLEFLLEQLQQHACHAAVCSCSNLQPLWWQLPGCVGCIIECSSIGSPPAGCELLQLLPMIAIRPPGLLHVKQQLLQQLQAAFVPQELLPQSPHAACCARQTPACCVPTSLSNCAGNECQQPTVVMDTAELLVSVSYEGVESLVAMLQDLVGAALSAAAAPLQGTSAECQKQTDTSSSNIGVVSEWQASQQVLACCAAAIKMAAAMWKQSSPCPAAEHCCLSTANTAAAHVSGRDICDSSDRQQGTADSGQAITPAERFAARLLVFCASWVVAGHCGQHNMQLLKEVLPAVLAGAGFAWAAPPAAVGGWFGARIELSTARWISWQHDVGMMCRLHAVSDTDGPEINDPPPPYHFCQGTTGMQQLGADSSDGNMSAAGSIGGSCGSWRAGHLFVPSARTCALQYLVYWWTVAGLSPLLLAPAGSGVKAATRQLLAHLIRPEETASDATSDDKYFEHGSCGACAGSRQLADSQVTVHDGGGNDVVVLPVPGSATASHIGGQLLQQLEQRKEQHRTSGAIASQDPAAEAPAWESSSNIWSGNSARLSSSSAATGSSRSWQSNLSLVLKRSSNKPATTTSSAGDAGLFSIAGTSAQTALVLERTMLYVEDSMCDATGYSTGGSSSLEWYRQLLETKNGIACSIHSCHAAAAGAGQACMVLPVQQPQLLGIILRSTAQRGLSNLASDQPRHNGQLPLQTKLARHMLLFQVDCLSVLPDNCMKTNGCASNSPYPPAAMQLHPQLGLSSGSMFSLTRPAVVLSAIFHQFAHMLPTARDVPRDQLIHGLTSIWADLAAAVQQLKRHGCIIRTCFFDMRHYRSSLQTLIQVLHDHMAQMDSNMALMDQHTTAAAGLQMPSDRFDGQMISASGAYAPCTPPGSGAAYAGYPASPGSPYSPQLSPGNVWSTSGGTMYGADACLSPSPPMQRFDCMPLTPSSPGVPAAGLQAECRTPGMNSRRVPLKTICCAVLDVLCRIVSDAAAANAADERALQRLILMLVVQHLALLDQQHRNTAAGSLPSNLLSRSGGSIVAQMVIASRAATQCGTAPSTDSWLLRMLMNLSLSDAGSTGSSGNYTTEAWQQLLQMPDAAFADKLRGAVAPLMLPARLLTQLAQIASLGRDPINSLEGLYVAAAQAELRQLLSQQAVAAAALTGAASAERCSESCSARWCMQPMQISCASRLLPCTAFISAAHKLMWWLQRCMTQQHMGNSGRLFSTTAPAPSGHAAASVAVLTGALPANLEAVAATAAAAIGAATVQLLSLWPGQAEQQLLQAIDAVAAAGRSALCLATFGVDANPVVDTTTLPVEDATMAAVPSTSQLDVADATAVPADAAAQIPSSPAQLILAVLDMHKADKETEQEMLQLLHCWSSQPPCCYSVAAATSQQAAPAAASYPQSQQRGPATPTEDEVPCTVPCPAATSAAYADVCVCFVVLCSTAQREHLLHVMPDLQQHCYQLALPTVQVAEQQSTDCKVQLSSCGWALVEHIKDEAMLAAHQQQQVHLLLNTEQHASGNNEAEKQQQQLVTAGAPTANPLTSQTTDASLAQPAARHLAEYLAAAMATIHQTIYQAYEDHYSANLQHSSSSKATKSCNSISSTCSGACDVISEQVASLQAAQAAPISKAFDALRLLPALLTEGRQQLVARRAALSACLATIAKTQQQVQAVLQQKQKHRRFRQQQHAVEAPTATSTETAAMAGLQEFDAIGAEIDVLQGLLHDLLQLTEKWRTELEQQVLPDLAHVLPTALLAAIELVYLGPLPRDIQQQLLATCRQLITAALIRRPGSSAAGARIGASLASVPAGGAASAAAVGSNDETASNTTGSSRSNCYLLQIIPHSRGLLPQSQLLRHLRLLQPEQPLYQCVQYAAAAAAVTAGIAGQPLLVIDPWQLLPRLLQLQGDNSTSRAIDSQKWVMLDGNGCSLHHDEGLTTLNETITAVQSALASCYNVCLQLHGDIADASAVAAAAAASYSVLQLQVMAQDLGNSNQGNTAAAGATLPICAQKWGTSKEGKAARRLAGAVADRSAANGALQRPGNRASACAIGAEAAADMPRLVIHISSSCMQPLPEELAGMCQVVDLSDRFRHSHNTAVSHGSSSSRGTQGDATISQHQQQCKEEGSESQFLPEVVSSLVLGSNASGQVAAAAAAAEAAERAQEQLQIDESRLVTKLCQELSTSSALPILLESLAASTAAFLNSEGAAAKLQHAAESKICELSASHKAIAQALVDCLHQHLAPGFGAVLSDGNNQQQSQQPVVPVAFTMAAIRRAALAAAAGSSADCSNAPEQQQQDAAAVRAVHVLLHQLLLVNTSAMFVAEQYAGTALTNSSHMPNSMTRMLRQPEGYLLSDIMAITSPTVPIAVVGTSAAAALATVYEAAAAAGVSADQIQLWTPADFCTRQGRSAPAAQAAAEESQTSHCSWLVVIIDEKSTQAVEAAATKLLDAIAAMQQQRCHDKRAEQQWRLRHGESSCSSPRLWAVVPRELAGAFTAATGNACLQYIQRTNSCSRSRPCKEIGSLLPGRQDLAAYVTGCLLQLEAVSCGNTSGVLQEGVQLNIVQPLLVAALAAKWRLHQMLVEDNSNGNSSTSRGSTASDLEGPFDMLHLQMLLRHVADATLAAANATKTTTTSSSSTDGSHVRDHIQDASLNSSCIPASISHQLKPLEHHTILPLGLLQAQQLLQWAVFAPSCTSRHAYELSRHALQNSFTPDALGVRSRCVGGSSSHGEVQIIGGHIADVIEESGKQMTVLQRQMAYNRHSLGCIEDGDSNLRESDSSIYLDSVPATCKPCNMSSSATGSQHTRIDHSDQRCSNDGADITGADVNSINCLLPLGMNLTSRELWALLCGRAN